MRQTFNESFEDIALNIDRNSTQHPHTLNSNGNFSVQSNSAPRAQPNGTVTTAPSAVPRVISVTTTNEQNQMSSNDGIRVFPNDNDGIRVFPSQGSACVNGEQAFTFQYMNFGQNNIPVSCTRNTLVPANNNACGTQTNWVHQHSMPAASQQPNYTQMQMPSVPLSVAYDNFQQKEDHGH